MEKIITILAAISTIIGVITTIYKIIFKDDRKRVEKYYEEILKPFIVEYHKNNDINAIHFLNKKAKRNNDAIPKYIFYLKDKGEDETENLKKILLVDYLDIYPNDSNKTMKFLDMLSRLMFFVLFAISFASLLFGSLCLVFSLFIFLQYLSDGNSISFDLFKFSGCCFIFSIVAMQMSRLIDYDMYTLKEKKIQRIIERKMIYYVKNYNKYIL